MLLSVSLASNQFGCRLCVRACVFLLCFYFFFFLLSYLLNALHYMLTLNVPIFLALDVSQSHIARRLNTIYYYFCYMFFFSFFFVSINSVVCCWGAVEFQFIHSNATVRRCSYCCCWSVQSTVSKLIHYSMRYAILKIYVKFPDDTHFLWSANNFMLFILDARENTGTVF